MTATTAKPVWHGPPPNCVKCGTILHPVLVELGFATHPCCDPGEEPWSWNDGTVWSG